jgi:hypothetical protein
VECSAKSIVSGKTFLYALLFLVLPCAMRFA